MVEETSFAVIIKMASTLLGSGLDTLKSMSGLFRELLASMGSVFGAGGLSAYIGAAIVLVVALLLVRFFLSESKLILSLVGIGILLFLIMVVF
jgi:hypothetical protein